MRDYSSEVPWLAGRQPAVAAPTDSGFIAKGISMDFAGFFGETSPPNVGSSVHMWGVVPKLHERHKNK
jgi:hypothetical protein